MSEIIDKIQLLTDVNSDNYWDRLMQQTREHIARTRAKIEEDSVLWHEQYQYLDKILRAYEHLLSDTYLVKESEFHLN